MATRATFPKTSLGGAGTTEVDLEALREDLERAARDAGIARARVSNLCRLGGGASKQLWAFDLEAADPPARPLVLRRNPPGAGQSAQALASVRAEAKLIQLAEAAGVPVPPIAFVIPEGSPAGDGYAMERLEGETLGPRVVRLPELAEARASMARR